MRDPRDARDWLGMDDKQQDDIMERLAALERSMLSMRKGELIGGNPLRVRIGGDEGDDTDQPLATPPGRGNGVVHVLKSGSDSPLVLGPVAARVTRNSSFIHTPSGSYVPIPFNEAEFDTGGFWNVSQPTRFTIPVDGIYMIGGFVEWDSNNVNSRLLLIKKNGAASGTNLTFGNLTRNGASLFAQLTASTLVELNAGEYVELFVFQDSGGNRLIPAAADYSPVFWISQQH